MVRQFLDDESPNKKEYELSYIKRAESKAKDKSKKNYKKNKRRLKRRNEKKDNNE